jgi:hypothetical protein
MLATIFLSLSDLFLTPIYLLLIYAAAYAIRPRVANHYTKKFFIPGLTVKVVGALTDI